MIAENSDFEALTAQADIQRFYIKVIRPPDSGLPISDRSTRPPLSFQYPSPVVLPAGFQLLPDIVM
jgi:hypothetical protein